MKVKVTQSYQTLCDPMNYTVHGILQARILEWVAFPFSRAHLKKKKHKKVLTLLLKFSPWAKKGDEGNPLSLNV